MSDELVREYEKIIDDGYRSLSLLTHSLERASYGILAAFDSHIVTELTMRESMNWETLSCGQVQMFKFLGEGVTWAMRWLLDGRDFVDVEPSDDLNLVESANDLIEYGAAYHRISMLYSSYSQERMNAVVSTDETKVRFIHKAELIETPQVWGFADEVSNEMLSRSTHWVSRLHELKGIATKTFRCVPYRLESGRIELMDFSLLRSDAVINYVNWKATERAVIAPDVNLGEFTNEDFMAFWKALYAWSVCTTEIYLQCYNQDIPQETCMPTQVVPRVVFIDTIATVSGISRELVERILQQLSADHRTKKFDIYLQPLICGENFVSWSVRVVQLSVPQRNLLKLMTRTGTQKDLADRIIGSREQSLVASFRTKLEDKGWAVEVTQNLSGPDQGEFDLIGWNWNFPEQLLIVEVKAFLQPDEPNEVRAATQEMIHGQEQIRRIIRLLKEMPCEIRKSRFPRIGWAKITEWYGIVVTPEGEPGLGFNHSVIPACSFASLQNRLTSKEWKSPYGLWRAVKERRWQSEIRAAKFDYEPIKLAGITFEAPQIIY